MPTGVIQSHFDDLYIVRIPLSKGGGRPLNGRDFAQEFREIVVSKLNNVCRFSAKGPTSLPTAASPGVSLGHLRGGPDTQRLLLCWVNFWFCQLLISVPSHLWGCQMAYLTLEWQPQQQVAGHPAYHHFTWLLQANGEPYLTRARDVLMINFRQTSGFHYPW